MNFGKAERKGLSALTVITASVSGGRDGVVARDQCGQCDEALAETSPPFAGPELARPAAADWKRAAGFVILGSVFLGDSTKNHGSFSRFPKVSWELWVSTSSMPPKLQA